MPKDTGAGRGTVTRNRRTEAAHGSGGKKRWRAVVAHSWWRAAVTRGGDTATRGGDTQRHVAATHSGGVPVRNSTAAYKTAATARRGSTPQ